MIAAQLVQSENDLIVVGGLLFLVLFSYYILEYVNDHFLFILVILSLCLMNTSDTLGGITVIPFLLLLNHIRNYKMFVLENRILRILLIILIVTNFLGYFLKNTTDVSTRLQSAIIFCGAILTFLFVQRLSITKSRFALFIKMATVLSFILFAVSVNQKFVIIDTSLPILGAVRYPSVSSLSHAFYGRFPSLVGDYEIFAEISLLMFILSFCIVITKQSITYFNLGNFPIVLLFISFLNILMTGTRSAFLLSFVFIFIFFLFKIRLLFLNSTLRSFLIILLFLPFILFLGKRVGLDIILERLNEINTKNISIQNLKSGEEMNRDIVYAAGYKRLAQDNWLVGYGFGRVDSNKIAWFGYAQESNANAIIEDFHSLYLSLPMIYGWIGGLSYLLMLVYIIILLFIKYFKERGAPFEGVTLGYAFVFLFFLIDQIKINSLRYYNYHLLIWILMAFALSFLRIRNAEDEDTVVY